MCIHGRKNPGCLKNSSRSGTLLERYLPWWKSKGLSVICHCSEARWCPVTTIKWILRGTMNQSMADQVPRFPMDQPQWGQKYFLRSRMQTSWYPNANVNDLLTTRSAITCPVFSYWRCNAQPRPCLTPLSRGGACHTPIFMVFPE